LQLTVWKTDDFPINPYALYKKNSLNFL